MRRLQILWLGIIFSLAPHLSPCFGDGWVGTKVLWGNDISAPVKVEGRTVCTLHDLMWPCLVEKENGDWLWIRDTKYKGWVQKEAVVPIDEFVRRATDNLRKNPSAHNYNARGSAWFCKEEYDFAIKDYSEAIRLEEHDETKGMFYRNRGETWLKKGDAQTAIGDLSEAARLQAQDPPNQYEAYRLRAIAYEKLGNKPAAEADRREAERIKRALAK